MWSGRIPFCHFRRLWWNSKIQLEKSTSVPSKSATLKMSHDYVTWLCDTNNYMLRMDDRSKFLVKMDHKWIPFGRFGPNFWLLADLLALVGSYRTSGITKGTIPCFFLVSSCLKSLHSQTPNPFIPLGNMYSLFCGWRINTGGQRDETSYGKINCFLLLTNHFWRHDLSSETKSPRLEPGRMASGPKFGVCNAIKLFSCPMSARSSSLELARFQAHVVHKVLFNIANWSSPLWRI